MRTAPTTRTKLCHHALGGRPKVRYRSPAHARKILRRQSRKLFIYQCQRCGDWHLTKRGLK